jgi:tetratricopeptide (TPR) repeat protein
MWPRPSVIALLLAVLLFSAFLCAQNKYEDLYLSGYVLFSDGSPPNEPVKVELACRGQVQQLSYTRADGYFIFRAGHKGDNVQTLAQKFSDRYHYNLDACQLSASLPGHTSTIITLGRRGIYQKAPVGTIVLLPEEDESSGLVSVEALTVPKDALKAYGEAKEELERENPNLEEAVTSLRRAVDLFPEFTAAWNLLGKSYIRANDLNQGREALTMAIRLDESFVEPCLTLALLELMQDRMIEAIAASERALAAMPDLAEAHFYRASAFNALGNLEEARVSLQAVLASPDLERLPRAYFLLGSVLAQEGKFTEAADHLVRYISLEPETRAAAAAAAQLKDWKQAGYVH